MLYLIWTLGYDYNHSSVKSLGHFGPKHIRKGLEIQNKALKLSKKIHVF